MKHNVAVDVNYFWSLYLAVLHTANRQETLGLVREVCHYENICGIVEFEDFYCENASSSEKKVLKHREEGKSELVID